MPWPTGTIGTDAPYPDERSLRVVHGTVREYLNAVMAFAGMYVDG
jgi:hypothetical protein